MSHESRYKSQASAFAVAIASVILMSPAQPADARPVVRDHRERPIVRDHRGDSAPGGGVTVSNSPVKRKHKKMWCIGIPCIY